MIICPVCEHQQAQGSECDVCGRQLAKARGAEEAPVPRMAELELTQVASRHIQAPPEIVPGLELHHAAEVAEVPSAPIPELDLARAADVTVPVEQMPDVELHREVENPAERTAAPVGAVTCRYCRNVQAEGAICDRCGMRLPKYQPAQDASLAPVWNEADAPIIRHLCGVKTRAGMPCSSCGVFVPMPS